MRARFAEIFVQIVAACVRNTDKERNYFHAVKTRTQKKIWLLKINTFNDTITRYFSYLEVAAVDMICRIAEPMTTKTNKANK